MKLRLNGSALDKLPVKIWQHFHSQNKRDLSPSISKFKRTSEFDLAIYVIDTAFEAMIKNTFTHREKNVREIF